MRIVMVGTGYVGLVTGACFAEMGHDVSCLDIDTQKIAKLRQGKIPIYEPGLTELVKKNVLANRLKFISEYKDQADAYFIAVPTPAKADGSCDLSYVEKAASQIASHIDRYSVIVNKSTVPVGTADWVRCTIQNTLNKRNANIPFDVVSNPEFLKEGAAINDCLHPDRIVIGTDTLQAEQTLQSIYAPFGLKPNQIFHMDIRSAEMTKYAANAMLAMRISFMNQIAEICKKTGANVNAVRTGIGSDLRIGPHFLNAGIGYGGSCFPKDVRALISIAKTFGASAELLEAADLVNQKQKHLLAQEIAKYFALKGSVQGKTIALWGLSFKPDTDDMREAPSLSIIPDLVKLGASLRLFDPVSMENAKTILGSLPNLVFCDDPYDAATGANAVALLTEWPLFRTIDFKKLKRCMQGSAIFDGRNQYINQNLSEKGFDYISIGMPDRFALTPHLKPHASLSDPLAVEIVQSCT